MFKVLSVFADLQDSNYVYNVGDVYPRVGYTPTSERIEALSTSNNLQRRPLIQLVEPEIVEEEPQAEEVVEKPARGRRKAKDGNNAN